jgi:MinD-like ATPase involved in chromosome partitioning or flagellar assembly
MLISVTAPRKGMGQTITSINIAAALTKIANEKILLVDANKQCSDIGAYLSDTNITKGLDDFVSMYNSNLLNRDSFNACVKGVHKIDIMSANECLDLNFKAIKVLLEYSRNIYKSILIDTISGKNPISHIFFEQSDVVIVVLNQSKHIVDMICKTELYKSYKGKLVFVVNRYMNKFEEKKFNYGINHIISQLKEFGYEDCVLPLAFDMDIINECNDNAVLNHVFNSNSEKGMYSRHLDEIINSLRLNNSNIKVNNENKKKNSFLSFLGIKGAEPFAT